MMGNILRTVSFGVIAYNEHRYLPDLLNDLIQQTYPKDLIEVILVDGESSDDTWQIMQSFQSQHLNEYKDIKILFLLLHICYGVGTMFGIVICLVSRIIEGEGDSEEVNSFFEIVAPCPIWTGVAA